MVTIPKNKGATLRNSPTDAIAADRLWDESCSELADFATDWLWESDVDDRLVYVSPRAARIIGVDLAFFMGKRRADYSNQTASPDKLKQYLGDIAARRPFRDFVFCAETPSGQRYIRISGKPLYDDEGGFLGYWGIGTQVTPYILAERQLLAAKEDAELANRTKSEFLANISHELRTPLNAILGFSQVIRDEVLGSVGNAKYLEYAKDIHASGEHLLGIIGDILDLAKVESGQATVDEGYIDITRVVTACVQLIRERAVAAGLTLTVEIAKALPDLRADERKFKQILINLLSNAVKFTQSGGAIAVAVAVDEQGGIALTVRDNGIGMEAEDIPLALAPFCQIDGSVTRRHEGTGLGLPLVKSLSELHDAAFELESTVDVGTLAIVRFPPERTVLELPSALPGRSLT